MVAQLLVRSHPWVDWRRVVALAGVVIMHVVLLAVILLPRQATDFERRIPPPQTTSIEWLDPPPLPPLPIQPVPPVPPPPLPIRTFVPPAPNPQTAAPVLDQSATVVDPTVPGVAVAVPTDIPSNSATSSTLGEPSPALVSLAYRHAPPPGYPYRSLHKGHEGTVHLRVLVDAAGLPQRIEIERSSGHRELDQAAIRAVRNWRFVAAQADGQARSAWALVPVDFSLRGSR